VEANFDVPIRGGVEAGTSQMGDTQISGDTVSERDILRQDCWTQALYAFGTAAIFERRAKILGRSLKGLAFMGIAVPLTIGGVVRSFSGALQYLEFALWIAGLSSLAQLILTAWSLINRWQDRHAYALASMVDNYKIAQKYEHLGKNPPGDLPEFK
jgi:mobilome CxxCx(11)CxxC protein